jgi:aryl-alcohol dehydrogenase-like predicted oxidoreductase
LKIILGTVQFGIDYGISNKKGKPSDEVLKAILTIAKINNIGFLDTARNYGNAEQRIGNFSNQEFKIISKFPKVSSITELNDVFLESLTALKSNNLYGYMAHNADVLIENPSLWKFLEDQKSSERIAKIGYSLYYPEQLEKLLNLGLIPDIVQIPFSILDRKFEKKLPVLKELGTEIHVRSVFLQGLYFMNPNELPEKLSSLHSSLTELQIICKENDRSIGEVALNYVIQNDFIDKVVIGVETPIQMEENIKLVSNWSHLDGLFSKIEAIEVMNKNLLNPVNW